MYRAQFDDVISRAPFLCDPFGFARALHCRGCARKTGKYVVEAAILLHHDNDVLNCGRRRSWHLQTPSYVTGPFGTGTGKISSRLVAVTVVTEKDICASRFMVALVAEGRPSFALRPSPFDYAATRLRSG